jgi:glycosyltransferase involved in cell wall biosynthesis
VKRQQPSAADAERRTPLVSVCLPVRNGAERLANVIESVLAQTHENLELVVCDNASTDPTEDICRELAASDQRILYHRHPANIGLLNNFIAAMRMSHGAFFRWVSHDDWLPPDSISRSLDPLLEDDRRILATTRVAYLYDDGVTRTDDRYDGVALASDDPIVRLTEMLRLLTESRFLVDPMYGLFRRSPVALIPRRNILKEDEVFAAKLALAGPWAHVPAVLVQRRTRDDSLYAIARRLDVHPWEAHVANALPCRDLLRWLPHAALTREQRRQARVAVLRMYVGRELRTVAHRTRKLARMVASLGRRV